MKILKYGRFARVAALCGAAVVAAPAAAQIPELRIQSGGFDLRLTGGAAIQGATFDDDNPATDTPTARSICSRVSTANGHQTTAF
jgi:hypothetical protein